MIPRLRFVALCALLAGCAPAEDAALVAKHALLSSADSLAIYSAGVDAYRAERFSDAREYWQRAAELGVREAAGNLGFLLYYSYGGPPDSAQARRLWHTAMVAQHAEAHRHVAQAILDGDRLLGSDEDGFSHAVAAFVLGRGTEQLSGEEVARDADPLVEAFRARLSPRAQVEAERRGRAWTERYPTT